MICLNLLTFCAGSVHDHLIEIELTNCSESNCISTASVCDRGKLLNTFKIYSDYDN